jgi:DNA end-binding protein Ku
VGKEAAPAKAAKPAKKPRKLTAGQREMLMPIEGKKPRKLRRRSRPPGPQRKSA